MGTATTRNYRPRRTGTRPPKAGVILPASGEVVGCRGLPVQKPKGVDVVPFVDRAEAGRRLAQRLTHLRGQDVVVLGLPRGGVPVAYEVARALDAPLDVIVVRKLGVPFQPELAMGAIGEDGVRITDPSVLELVRIDDGEVAAVEKAESVELQRRVDRPRRGRRRVPLAGRTAVPSPRLAALRQRVTGELAWTGAATAAR